jgi:hypothetical protein
MVRWHAGKALAGATGGWIDLRGQPSGCGRRGTGRVRSCSEGDICRRLRDMPDHHTLNLRQRRDAGCMMFERGVSRLTLGSSGSSTPGSRCGSDRSSGGDEQYPSGSRGPGCWARTNCPPTMPGGRCAATGPSARSAGMDSETAVRKRPRDAGGLPLAIRRREQRATEAPVRGVSLPGPRPRLDTPDSLPMLWPGRARRPVVEYPVCVS